VACATGAARSTVTRRVDELDSGATDSGRVRRASAGRKRADAVNPELTVALERLVDPDSRGDPELPLRWTIKSTRQLSAALTGQGIRPASGPRAGLRNTHHTQKCPPTESTSCSGNTQRSSTRRSTASSRARAPSRWNQAKLGRPAEEGVQGGNPSARNYRIRLCTEMIGTVSAS
jgi:hypothetical protein